MTHSNQSSSNAPTKKKTLLYLITQSELGGAQRYVFDLAKNLAENYQIVIAFGEPGEQGELAGQLRQAHLPYYLIPNLKRQIAPINDLKALWQIKKLIKHLKPDIIHLNSSKISILGSLAVKTIHGNSSNNSRPIRIIYTAHGWVFNEPLSTWKKIFYQYAEKLTARFKDRLICVSEFDRQTALKEKICSADKLITIHNGIEPISYLARQQARQIISQQAAAQNQASAPDSRLWIGSIGNLYPTKDFSCLIQAVRLVKDAGLDFQSFIIGQGPDRPKLTSLIQQLNLTTSCRLLGRIDQAARLLPAFDFYVCSSVKEGLSYTVLEAMQAGLAIVASSVGGNPELIEHQKNGLLVEPQQPEQLAAKIIELASDRPLAERLGRAAQTTVLKHFSLKKMITETKTVYQEN